LPLLPHTTANNLTDGKHVASASAAATSGSASGVVSSRRRRTGGEAGSLGGGAVTHGPALCAHSFQSLFDVEQIENALPEAGTAASSVLGPPPVLKARQHP
jgi:hypothetical protein